MFTLMLAMLMPRRRVAAAPCRALMPMPCFMPAASALMLFVDGAILLRAARARAAEV